MAPSTTEDVLNFWFGAEQEDGEIKLNPKVWWGAAADVDQEIRKRFTSTVEEVARSLEHIRHGNSDDEYEDIELLGTPEGCLAAVILLDQFPRNIWRTKPHAFKYDDIALCIVKYALHKRFDETLKPVQRLFLYICLEHSESMDDVNLAATKVGILKYRSPSHLQRFFASQHRNVLKHVEIIRTYGRYPYRNAILGRANTPEEDHYLASGKLPTFAQRTIKQKGIGNHLSTYDNMPSSSSTSPKRKLKILVLHGFRQGRAVFKKKTSKLRIALQDIADLEYAQAPLTYVPDEAARKVAETALGQNMDEAVKHQKVWWNAEGSGDDVRYNGVDSSLAYLQDLIRVQGPFDGIAGYAQGGTMATIIASMETSFKFVVLISSFPPRDAVLAASLAARIDRPSLHIWGKKDILIDPSRSLALADLFIDPQTAPHEGAHFVPNFWPYDAIQSFCRQFNIDNINCNHSDGSSSGSSNNSNSNTLDAITQVESLLPPQAVEIAATLLNNDTMPINSFSVASLVEKSFAPSASKVDINEDAVFSGLFALAWEARQRHNTVIKVACKHGESEETLHRNNGLPDEKLGYYKLFSSIFVELYLRYPSKVLRKVAAIPSQSSWCDLNRIAKTADEYMMHGDDSDTEQCGKTTRKELLTELIQYIAGMFAEQLIKDVETCLPEAWVEFCLHGGEKRPPSTAPIPVNSRPSYCAFAAPRRKTSMSQLSHEVAYKINPLHVDRYDPSVDPGKLAYTTGQALERYRTILAKLCGILQIGTTKFAAMEERRSRERHVMRIVEMHTADVWHALREKNQPLSDAILHPRPEPVTPCTAEQLQPVLDWLKSDTAVTSQRAFVRGTAVPDGRLDLCKQVVGPQGIEPLMNALVCNSHATRLLLGNNIVSDSGAPAIAQHVRSGKSPLTTLYIAGNDFTVKGITPICAALEADKKIDMLWLKRNPLLPAGAVPIAKMMRVNRTIHTLDLVNTGLLDEGAATIINALDESVIENLYIGSNGLTLATALLLAKHFKRRGLDDKASFQNKLRTLSVSIGRFGDEGAIAIADSLTGDTHLQRLFLSSNRIGPQGGAAIAKMLMTNTTIQVLDLGFNKSTVALGEIGNRVGDEGAQSFADVIEHNTTLRSLDLLHNGISQKGLDVIRTSLRNNTTLINLVYSSFGVTLNDIAREEVATITKRNKARLEEAGEDTLEIEIPDHIAQIYSVYRTK